MDDQDHPIVILITAPSREVAQQIAQALLEHHLAACINLITGVQSLYRWEGQLQNDEEVLLLVKSRSEIFQSQLIPLVRQLHPYQLPELIVLPILDGYPPYLDWLRQETQKTQNDE
ncbi:MAG: divalent-cation tolerance protein CutA [Candidatus Kryptoniota bacterium]